MKTKSKSSNSIRIAVIGGVIVALVFGVGLIGEGLQRRDGGVD